MVLTGRLIGMFDTNHDIQTQETEQNLETVLRMNPKECYRWYIDTFIMRLDRTIDCWQQAGQNLCIQNHCNCRGAKNVRSTMAQKAKRAVCIG